MLNETARWTIFMEVPRLGKTLPISLTKLSFGVKSEGNFCKLK